MKSNLKWTVAVGLLAIVGMGNAQEYGRVVSSTANVQKVAVPRQVCSSEQVTIQDQKSGAGAIMGAIAGGAIGNQIGRGAGNALATVVGVVGGAIAGDKIEGPGRSHVESVQNCSTQTVYENRISGYTVVYEYAGKRYSTQMPDDPGPSIQVQVTPVGAGSASAVPLSYVPLSTPTSNAAPVDWQAGAGSYRERQRRSW
jgi:uncharacterized protein YcfJ